MPIYLFLIGIYKSYVTLDSLCNLYSIKLIFTPDKSECFVLLWIIIRVILEYWCLRKYVGNRFHPITEKNRIIRKIRSRMAHGLTPSQTAGSVQWVWLLKIYNKYMRLRERRGEGSVEKRKRTAVLLTVLLRL